MCKAKSEGGRCAGHIRPELVAAQQAYAQAVAAWDEAAAAARKEAAGTGRAAVFGEGSKDAATGLVHAERQLSQKWSEYAATPEGYAAAVTKLDWPANFSPGTLIENGRIGAHEAAQRKARARGAALGSFHEYIDDRIRDAAKKKAAEFIKGTGQQPYDPAPARDWRPAIALAREWVCDRDPMPYEVRQRLLDDIDAAEATFRNNGARCSDVYETLAIMRAERPEWWGENGRAIGGFTRLEHCPECGRFIACNGGHACPGPQSTAEAASTAAAQVEVAQAQWRTAQEAYAKAAAPLLPPEGAPEFPQGISQWSVGDADERWPGDYPEWRRDFDDDLRGVITPGGESYTEPGYSWEISDEHHAYRGYSPTPEDAVREAEQAAWYVASGRAEADAVDRQWTPEWAESEPAADPDPATVKAAEKARQDLAEALDTAKAAQARHNAAQSRYWTSRQGRREYDRLTTLSNRLSEAGHPTEAAKVAARMVQADTAVRLAPARSGVVCCPACREQVLAATDHACPVLNKNDGSHSHTIIGQDRRDPRHTGVQAPAEYLHAVKQWKALEAQANDAPHDEADGLRDQAARWQDFALGHKSDTSVPTCVVCGLRLDDKGRHACGGQVDLTTYERLVARPGSTRL